MLVCKRSQFELLYRIIINRMVDTFLMWFVIEPCMLPLFLVIRNRDVVKILEDIYYDESILAYLCGISVVIGIIQYAAINLLRKKNEYINNTMKYTWGELVQRVFVSVGAMVFAIIVSIILIMVLDNKYALTAVMCVILIATLVIQYICIDNRMYIVGLLLLVKDAFIFLYKRIEIASECRKEKCKFDGEEADSQSDVTEPLMLTDSKIVTDTSEETVDAHTIEKNEVPQGNRFTIGKVLSSVVNSISVFGGANLGYAFVEFCIYLGITLLITLIFRIGITQDDGTYVGDVITQYVTMLFPKKADLQLPDSGIIGAILNIKLNQAVYRFLTILPIGGAISGVLCSFWGKGAVFWLLNKPASLLKDWSDSIEEAQKSRRQWRKEDSVSVEGILVFIGYILLISLYLCIGVFMPLLIWIDVIVGCVQTIRNTYMNCQMNN